jgi:hypothetical protein
MSTIDKIKDAGADIIRGADFPGAEEIIFPGSWDGYVLLLQFLSIRTMFN